MARPRQYATAAERQAAYRERKALADVDATLPERDLAEPEPIPPPPTVPPPRLSLDQYVDEAIIGAELHHAATSSLATLSTVTLAEQIERAESYARWRYAGYLDGSVNGL